MLACEQTIDNLEQLRQYVQLTLCEHEQLEPGAFPLTERVLVRGGRPCAIFYCLHGPRAVKFSAIWETDANTVLFYGCDGQRFHKARLLEAPRISAGEIESDASEENAPSADEKRSSRRKNPSRGGVRRRSRALIHQQPAA